MLIVTKQFRLAKNETLVLLKDIPLGLKMNEKFTLNNLLEDIEKEKVNHRKAIEELTKLHDKKINEIQESFDKKIKLLNEEYSNQIKALELKISNVRNAIMDINRIENEKGDVL